MASHPDPKQFQSKTPPALDANWQALKNGISIKLWRPLIPAARYCVPLGIRPSHLDDVCIAAMMEVLLTAGRDIEPKSVETQISAMRLASHRIRCDYPKMNGPGMSYQPRRTPRQDQFDALPDTLRADILKIESEFNQAQTARISLRNLLLRGVASCSDANLSVTRLTDLFGMPAVKVILRDAVRFGDLDKLNGSRSKLLEVGVRILEAFGDQHGAKWLNSKRKTGKKVLTRPKNEIPHDVLVHLDQFLDSEALKELIEATEISVMDFASRGGKRRRIAAQGGLAIRCLLALSLTRDEVMTLRFDGSVSARASLERPELRVGMGEDRRSVEEALSPLMVSLLDRYVERCRREGLPFTTLLALTTGKARDDTTFSVTVSRVGEQIGLKLTPKVLFTLTVAILIKFGKENPKKLRLNDIKSHLGIAQFGNFMTRFGRLVDDGVFDHMARSLGLQR